MEEAKYIEHNHAIEKLAALEHKQWVHWMKYMIPRYTPENVLKWAKQADTPYEELSEKEKESDREWARKVMDILFSE